jgi:large subunit ribosomal protein L15
MCLGIGRQIMALETTKAILSGPVLPDKETPDPYGRQPFEHMALAKVDKLSSRQPHDIMQKEKMAQLALDVGLHDVLRWKPRLVSFPT